MISEPVRVPALRVRQWLRAWDNVRFSVKDHQDKPEPYFYLLSMEASLLRRLTGANRREVGAGERLDTLGIQRRHDEARSKEIAEYIQLGFPWAELPERSRLTDEFRHLRKPGWLPTALVVNILGSNDRRAGRSVAPGDLVRIGAVAKNGQAEIELPTGSMSSRWRPTSLPPFEIVDGQHRLWAFDEANAPDDYELPVVAFHALDISWQAYLFYVINIKPKRINRSLAYDLYPLLRTEEWLEKFEGAAVYRETRAQELTEILWSHPQSPWRNRINMLGDPGKPGVTQAAWVRSLVTSLIKSWDGRGRKLGGLFGAPVGSDRLALLWSRAQQAAFLILLWHEIASAMDTTQAEWVRSLDQPTQRLFSPLNIANSDQGVRAILQVANDCIYVRASQLKLFDWVGGSMTSEGVNLAEVTAELRTAREQPFAPYLAALGVAIASFDWRSTRAPELSEEERLSKMAFRGSGGYGELRRQLLRHVQASTSSAELRAAAETAAEALNG